MGFPNRYPCEECDLEERNDVCTCDLQRKINELSDTVDAVESIEASNLKPTRKVVNGELMWHVKAGKHKMNYYGQTLTQLYRKLIDASLLPEK